MGCGGAELVASAWGLTRPHFMARPSAPSDPVNSPPPRQICVFCDVCVGVSCSLRVEGIIANNFPPRPRGWLMTAPNHLRFMYHHPPFYQYSFDFAAGWGLVMTRYPVAAGRVGLYCGPFERFVGARVRMLGLMSLLVFYCACSSDLA